VLHRLLHVLAWPARVTRPDWRLARKFGSVFDMIVTVTRTTYPPRGLHQRHHVATAWASAVADLVNRPPRIH
jgi:hypothetical protein